MRPHNDATDWNVTYTALEQIDSGMVAALSDQFFSDVHVEMLVFGNALKQGIVCSWQA